jgi:ABC-type amino acid transport substrate-binding protein
MSPRFCLLATVGLCACGASTPDEATDAAAPTTPDAADPDARTIPAPDAAPLVAEAYAHTATSLYRFDLVAEELGYVGELTGCRDVMDIAVDSTGRMVAVGRGGGNFLYDVDPTTAQCSDERPLGGTTLATSLSFVPRGALDPGNEVLVMYDVNVFKRIDQASGMTTPIGQLDELLSSGDLVAVADGPTLLTVESSVHNSLLCDDCLIEVDPSSGEELRNWGSLGYRQVYGLSYWDGAVYGFDRSGAVFRATFAGDALDIQELTVVGASGLAFLGAGSRTNAPSID